MKETLETIINSNGYLVDIFIVRDFMMLGISIILLSVYIFFSISDISVRIEKKVNRKYFVDRFFYRFLRLQFIFIIVYLFQVYLLLGLLDYDKMGCLITKFFVSLGFFLGSLIIFLIELVFTHRYSEYYDNTKNTDNIWNGVKLIITICFLSLFAYSFVLDFYNLLIIYKFH